MLPEGYQIMKKLRVEGYDCVNRMNLYKMRTSLTGSRLPIQQLLEKAYEVYPPATINIY